MTRFGFEPWVPRDLDTCQNGFTLKSGTSLVNLVNPVLRRVANRVGESIEFTVNQKWPYH